MDDGGVQTIRERPHVDVLKGEEIDNGGLGEWEQ